MHMKSRPVISYQKNVTQQVFRQSPDSPEAYAWALQVLKTLDGLTHAEIRHILREADVILSNTTILDCGSDDFQAVLREYLPDAQQ
ncbi:hypothetical protein ACVBEF_15750 [Glaciimonas sp. GG7]